MKYTIVLGKLPETTLKEQSFPVKRPAFASPLLKLRCEDPKDHPRVMKTLKDLNAIYAAINPIHHIQYDDGSLEIIIYLTYFLRADQDKDYFAPLPLVYSYSNICLFFPLLELLIPENSKLDDIFRKITLDLIHHFANNRAYYANRAIDFESYDKEIKTLFGNSNREVIVNGYLRNPVLLQSSYFSLFPKDLTSQFEALFPVVPENLSKNHFLNYAISEQGKLIGQILAILNHSYPQQCWKYVGNLIQVNPQQPEIIKILKLLEFRRIIKFHSIDYVTHLPCKIITPKTGEVKVNIDKGSFIMITEIDAGKLQRYFENITDDPNNCPFEACSYFVPLNRAEPISAFAAVDLDEIVEPLEKTELEEELLDLKQILEDLLALDPSVEPPLTLGKNVSVNLHTAKRNATDQRTLDTLEVVTKLYAEYRGFNSLRLK